MIRVGIIEDDATLRDALAGSLAGRTDLSCTGAFAAAEPALAAWAKCPPEAAVIDLGLPGIDGVEAIRRLKALHPEVDVVAYTVFEDAERVFGAIRAGASGYVLKEASPAELLTALGEVRAGASPITPRIARRVLEHVRATGAGELRPRAELGLTPREYEILELVVKGATARDVGRALFISPETVRTHVRHIYDKLEVASRAEAVAAALGR